MICVSLSHIGQIGAALRSNPGLIELRMDLIREDPKVVYSRLGSEVRSIATCRPGGYSEEQRVALLKTCMEQGASYIDIEVESPEDTMQALLDHAQKWGRGVIVSHHDFETTPVREELGEIYLKCRNRGGNIVKVATRVNAVADIRNLLSLYDLPGKKVVIGMGPLGRITRITAPYLGAEFTFASLDEGVETAPGQFTITQLKAMYNVIDES